MIHPTDEQLAAAEVDATARFAEKGERIRIAETGLLEIEIDAPIDAAIYAVPFTFDSYVRHFDMRQRDLETAQTSCFVQRTAWPARDEALALAARSPAIASKVEAELMGAAGTSAVSFVLTEIIPGLTLAGVPLEAVEAALAKCKQRVLAGKVWGLSHPLHRVSALMLSPDPAVYQAARAGVREAQQKGSGSLRAPLHHIEDVLTYVSRARVDEKGETTWSETRLATLLDETPALVEDFIQGYFKSGGSGANSRRRFRQRARSGG